MVQSWLYSVCQRFRIVVVVVSGNVDHYHMLNSGVLTIR